ncbi:hypothetical protein RFI_33840, partial [Reticulomyxa filosa]
MVVVHLSSAYGSTSGTSTGPSGPSGQSTAITKFSVWATSDYLCLVFLFFFSIFILPYKKNGFILINRCIQIVLGDNNCHIWRYQLKKKERKHKITTHHKKKIFVNNTKANGTKTTVQLGSGEWVSAIYVDVDNQGILRGISFDSNIVQQIMTVGYIGDGLTTFCQCGITVVWGIKFYYTTPTFSALSDLALPALGILAHSAVVGQSYSKVDELKSQLSIAAPSCDPPQGTDPQKVQLWYRTFRAHVLCFFIYLKKKKKKKKRKEPFFCKLFKKKKENCKESFLVYAPSILIASTFGRE